jgi:phosphoglycerate kinase
VILASHLGKPKGTVMPELSLKHVADVLTSMLKISPVKFIGTVLGESVKQARSTL